MSGKVPASQRQQLALMFAAIHDAEALFLSKLDRLGRDPNDVGATIKALEAPL